MSIKQPLSELLTGEKKLSVILNPEYFKDLKKVTGIYHMRFPQENRLMISVYLNGDEFLKTFICS